MLIGKVITNDNLSVKKYCIDEGELLYEILYILSPLLKNCSAKKIFMTLRCTIHEACGGVDCFF